MDSVNKRNTGDGKRGAINVLSDAPKERETTGAQDAPGEMQGVTGAGESVESAEKSIEKQRAEAGSPEERIIQLEEQVKRISAEFENFRKRQEKRYNESVRYAAEDVIAQFIPVLDSIAQAHATAQRDHDIDALLKGLEMIKNQLGGVLENLGVDEIGKEGEPFDTAYHNALMTEENNEYPDETVIQVIQKGYKYKDRVIRPAMVKVSRNTAG